MGIPTRMVRALSAWTGAEHDTAIVGFVLQLAGGDLCQPGTANGWMDRAGRADRAYSCGGGGDLLGFDARPAPAGYSRSGAVRRGRCEALFAVHLVGVAGSAGDL